MEKEEIGLILENQENSLLQVKLLISTTGLKSLKN